MTLIDIAVAYLQQNTQTMLVWHRKCISIHVEGVEAQQEVRYLT